MMKKEHNIEYVKRLAKQIKKDQSVPHYQALNQAAVKIGFTNWKHCQNALKPKDSVQIFKDERKVTSKFKSKNIDPYRNLLVAGVNELLEKKCISLIYESDFEESGHIFIKLLGYDSVVIWRSIGFGELSISVWWKYDHCKHPQANLEGNQRERFSTKEPLALRNKYKNFVGVVVSCCFERKDGRHIQGEKRDGLFMYTRKGELDALKKLPIQKPKGYNATGLMYI